MFSNRAMQIAFLISVIAHGVILFQNPTFKLFSIDKNLRKQDSNIEISYLKKSQEVKINSPKINLPNRDPVLDLSAKITVDKINRPSPYIEKGSSLNKNINIDITPPKPILNKPVFAKPDIIAIKKKITLPPVDFNKIDSPSYISYYQVVREKIRRTAYQNYTRTDVGDVYLAFTISNDGYLKEVRLVEEKSSPNPYLRGISLKSVNDASPFPDFPDELNYPQLSFNVVISFEVE